MEAQHLNIMADYIVPMATTIQISKELLEELKKRKHYVKESYEDVIWGLIEDTMELREETKRDMQISRQQIKEGKVYTLERVKKELGL
jgi:predicted CopG family antitoxin